MTKSDIVEIIAKVPALTSHGIGIFEKRLPVDERRLKFKENQDELLDSADDCTKICQWLADKEAIKTADKDSYWLKHVAEREIGYVTNGQFIAAAIHCGFPYSIVDGSANVLFGISKKSLGSN